MNTDPVMAGNLRFLVTINGRAEEFVQPDQDGEANRVILDDLMQNAWDALMISADNAVSLEATAAAITAAGRALAVDASNGADPAQAAFATANADMVNFTCTLWLNAGCDAEIQQHAKGLAITEILQFEADFCGSNVD